MNCVFRPGLRPFRRDRRVELKDHKRLMIRVEESAPFDLTALVPGGVVLAGSVRGEGKGGSSASYMDRDLCEAVRATWRIVSRL